MKKRVFLIVLDSVGAGSLPDAAFYGDEGANTLKTIAASPKLHIPNLIRLGLGNISGLDFLGKADAPIGAYGKLAEASAGKDTTTGHWEISGLISEKAFPTFPKGFPKEVIESFERITGRKALCNKPYSGTEVIKDFGREHMETGAYIVYTSADSVLQIAAHEDIVPLETLYADCKALREMMSGDYAVGRVIARPFIGSWPNFERTPHRHDFSLVPPGDTMLDILQRSSLDTIALGKISDIFAGKGISSHTPTSGNTDGMEKTLEAAKKDFHGLCFVNLVDFDMLYGHRNNIDGYAEALSEFDKFLPKLTEEMKEEDVLLITADHGCDPGYPTTDHTREYIPLIVYSKGIIPKDLGVRATFADIGKSVCELLGVELNNEKATSFIKEIFKKKH